jgi:DNA-binding transcriptional LysR family regulator
MDTKKLDLNLLLALEALLTERNVTRAARRLNLSQPALSTQLARLRTLFADELFVPTSRGVLPTARALELQQPLRDALDRLREVVKPANTFDPAASPLSFSFAGTDYMQVAVLLPFLLELRSEAPDLRAQVRLSDSRTITSELEQGDADIAFLQPERVDGALRSQLLLEEKYVGIARKGSLGGRSMSLKRFLTANHVIVSPRGEGFRGPTDAALEKSGHERKVCFAVSSFIFLVEAVANSDLLAMAPKRLALLHADKLDMFEAPVTVPGFSISMIWHDRTHHHAGQMWLRQRLLDFCLVP